MNIEKTRSFYTQMKTSDLCECAYCKNYVKEIKSTYPELSKYLNQLGIDIEKPFETMPLDPDITGYINYACSQYIVIGALDDFVKTKVGQVNIGITSVHPSTGIKEEHFVIEINSIRLKWNE